MVKKNPITIISRERLANSFLEILIGLIFKLLEKKYETIRAAIEEKIMTGTIPSIPKYIYMGIEISRPQRELNRVLFASFFNCLIPLNNAILLSLI